MFRPWPKHEDTHFNFSPRILPKTAGFFYLREQAGVDEKAITGESIPVEKKEGDEVIGATINKTGVLKFRATRVGKDTMLAQIVKIVEEAMGSKAPIQLLADKVSFYFVPSVIGIAILSFVIWLLLGQPLALALWAWQRR